LKKQNNIKVLIFYFIHQVALGKWNELYHADNNANKLPAGLSSVKALGSIAPNPKNEVTL